MADLARLVRSGLKQKNKRLPLAPGGYLRASSLGRICPREEVLVARHQVVRESAEDADLFMTFAHGHGLHYAAQNHVLPALGILVGKWICLTCGFIVGAPREAGSLLVEDGVPPPVLEGVLVPRPKHCIRCGDAEFLYRELHFEAREYGTGGHPDGFLRMEGRLGLGVFELKSCALPWEVRAAPYLEHLVQVQTYLWFTGLKWALILYWHKAGDGVAALIPHFVTRDELTIDEIKSTLRSVWDGLEGGPLPARVCAHADAPLAKSCPVGAQCFAVKDPANDYLLEAEEPVDDGSAGFAEAAAGAIF